MSGTALVLLQWLDQTRAKWVSMLKEPVEREEKELVRPDCN